MTQVILRLTTAVATGAAEQNGAFYFFDFLYPLWDFIKGDVDGVCYVSTLKLAWCSYIYYGSSLSHKF